MTDKTLPHNLDAEVSVLGSVMVSPKSLDVIDLQPTEFYRDGHRRIFEAILRMAERRTAIDTVTLKNELQRTGELDDVGGPMYIAQLSDGVPQAMNVRYYAAIVREKARMREVIFASNAALVEAYDAADPVDTILARAEAALARVGQTTHTSTHWLKDGASEFFADLEQRNQRKTMAGLSTGFASIDQLSQGWQPGDLTVVGARPSVGKTTFVMNTVTAAAQTGKRVLVLSMEMTRRQLEFRLLSSLSGVGLSRLTSGHTGSADHGKLANAFETFSRLPIAIDDRSALTVRDVRNACRRMKAEGPLDLVAIDYIQLMAGDTGRKGTNRAEELADASRRIKTIAKELHVPILLLSQLNRENQKRADEEPRLSDLKDCGSLEQDADNVLFLHRTNHATGGQTKWILAKQRNGPTGSDYLTLDRETTTFQDGGAAPPAPPVKARRGRVGEE